CLLWAKSGHAERERPPRGGCPKLDLTLASTKQKGPQRMAYATGQVSTHRWVCASQLTELDSQEGRPPLGQPVLPRTVPGVVMARRAFVRRVAVAVLPLGALELASTHCRQTLQTLLCFPRN